MKSKVCTAALLEELRMEIPATRKCLEHIAPEHFKFKPHETSMEMGYLAGLVAEIPLWIEYMIKVGEIDFATYPRFEFKSTEELISHFDDCIQRAEIALKDANDSILEKKFTLKRNGVALYSAALRKDLPTTLNHWVHHRGQLTVYMRMNGIAVPSIYGPSADDKIF